MRNTLVVLTLLIMLPACGLIGGIQESSPAQRWDMASGLYVKTLQALKLLRKAGYIDDELHAQLITYRKAARKAIDSMEMAIRAPETGDFEMAWSAFSAAIDELIRAKIEAAAAKAAEEDPPVEDPPAEDPPEEPTEDAVSGGAE